MIETKAITNVRVNFLWAEFNIVASQRGPTAGLFGRSHPSSECLSGRGWPATTAGMALYLKRGVSNELIDLNYRRDIEECSEFECERLQVPRSN